MKKKLRILNNWIVASDAHCGCQLGLCSPDGADLDEGGLYMPTPLQLKVYAMWEEFWGDWVPKICKGEPYGVIWNGDALEGVHHNATTQWTQNLTDQSKAAERLFKPIVEKCDGRFYFIRGTEAHAGPSGATEEALAKTLSAIPDDDGRYARWELWVKVGDKGLAHVTHHIGIAGSLAYETSAIQKELEQAFVEAGRWNNEIPDFICRSHRHRNIETRIQTYKGFAQAFITAGWQLKTPLVFRMVGGRATQPQIGGSLMRCGDEDLFSRHKVWNIERPRTETIYV